MLNRAIELDPDYANLCGLANAYNREFQNKWLGFPNSLEIESFMETTMKKNCICTN